LLCKTDFFNLALANGPFNSKLTFIRFVFKLRHLQADEAPVWLGSRRIMIRAGVKFRSTTSWFHKYVKEIPAAVAGNLEFKFRFSEVNLGLG